MSEVFNFHSTKNTLDDGRTFYIRLLLRRPHLFNVFTYKENESERTKTVSSFFRNNLVSAYMITHVVQWCFTYKNDLHCIQSINGYFMFLIPLWHQTVWVKVKWLRFYPSLSSDSRGACERSYRDPSRGPGPGVKNTTKFCSKSQNCTVSFQSVKISTIILVFGGRSDHNLGWSIVLFSLTVSIFTR